VEVGVPVWLLIAMLVVLPGAVGLLFGAFSFRHVTRQVFTCRRCGRAFSQRAQLPFPTACGKCRSREWNVVSG
jgi:hypothetical protein